MLFLQDHFVFKLSCGMDRRSNSDHIVLENAFLCFGLIRLILAFTPDQRECCRKEILSAKNGDKMTKSETCWQRDASLTKSLFPQLLDFLFIISAGLSTSLLFKMSLNTAYAEFHFTSLYCYEIGNF